MYFEDRHGFSMEALSMKSTTDPAASPVSIFDGSRQNLTQLSCFLNYTTHRTLEPRRDKVEPQYMWKFDQASHSS